MAVIEDYALVGDCETAALIGRDGSVDWLCWPRFDSGACFAALLGSSEHGRWRVAPMDERAKVTRRYRGDTMILETSFTTAEGSVLVIDFMPPKGGNSDLVRIVVGQEGTVKMRSELVLRFGYGAIVPWVTHLEDGALRAIAGPDMVVLRADVPLRGLGLRTESEFNVSAGEQVPFVLTWGPSYKPQPESVEPLQALELTERFWLDWSSRCTYQGEWREAVMRSLLTLKALTFHPTGGIVAAATTSLPEELGGTRNWDYRVCWLRDATLTLLALMDGGYYDEAQAWRDWLLRAAAGSPDQVQIMYGLRGERHLLEWEVPWLPGYEHSTPVRIGNAAHSQLQIDVFGEVMDALHSARSGGLPESEVAWQLEKALVKHLERVWTSPDRGIWEVRGAPQHFTHSKVMAWVAMDRAIRSVEEFHLDGPLEEWRALRAQIHAEVCERGYDPELGSFVQAYGSRQLDASLLLMPLVGFLPAADERVLGTVKAIEQRLLAEGFVYRYDAMLTDDGLPGGEGAFLACSFWLADNYVLLGRDADARTLFQRLLDVRNDVGLLAEEYDPGKKRQVGNYPQAFSHIALVTTAFNLDRAKTTARSGYRGAERRARPR